MKLFWLFKPIRLTNLIALVVLVLVLVFFNFGAKASNSQSTQTIYPNLWDELRAKFELKTDQKNIRPHLLWLKDNPDYFIRVAERSADYIYYIKEELKKANMPLDIALLPWVESAYYPFAYSPSRASGIWQFTPYTGKIYGLRQNYWYDGRRDIRDSTRAAIVYLKYLYKKFDGDWLIALAAYNSGEGRVSRAISKNKKQNKATDFFSLKLPKETKGYVPRLLAIAHMIKNSEKYELNLPYIENKAVVEIIEMNEQIDISLLAKLADLSVEEIYTFNPGFNRWATEPNIQYKIMLPIENGAKFKQAFEQYPKNNLITWVRHKIKKGDSLSEIAYEYRTNISFLKKINQLENNTLIAGKHLIIPIAKKPSKEYVLSQAMRDQKRFNRVRDGIKTIHSVKQNESLWSIAEKYDIRMSDLIRWNNLSRKSVLQINQKLVLWYEPDQKEKENIERVLSENQYLVNSGDTLSEISSKYQIPIKNLAMVNNISEFNELRPGDILTIPNHDFVQPIIEYTIQKNDTISKIAKKYNLKVDEIMQINNLENENKIKVGQKLKLIGFLSANEVDNQMLPSPNSHSVIRQITYLVKSGDSLAKIADKFKLKVADILKWNQSIKRVDIYPNQKLTLYIDLTHF